MVGSATCGATTVTTITYTNHVTIDVISGHQYESHYVCSTLRCSWRPATCAYRERQRRARKRKWRTASQLGNFLSCSRGPFVDHLLNTDEPRAGATVMSEDREIAALVVVLQLGRWQHRVIVPLLGTTVSTYLAALKTTGMPVGLELSAQDLPQAKRFDVQLSEERLSEALDAHRYVVEDCSIMSYRRALGRHCIVMANPSAIPGHPAEKWVQTVSVGRVWPPELPFPGVGSYAWSKK